MSPVAIVAVCVLAIFITGLLVFIIKTSLTPKRVDSIPKLIKQGKTQNAIKMAKQILTKDPKNYIAHYYLGKAYLKENKSELAIIEYKLVNENALFGPQLDELTFRQEFAQLLMKYNQLQEALRNYLLLTKLEPNNPENFYNTGYLYEQANRYDLAMGFMQKTVMLNSRHAKAHAEIGLMHYRTKNFGEAKKEIDIAIKLSPETYSSYYYLGKIEKDAKDLGAAIKSFEKAQRDPEIKQKAIIEHGSCFMLANRFDNAALDFQRAIELDKENLNGETLYARYFLATCYEKSRQIEKAIEQWEQIYKRNKAFRDVSAKLSEYKDLQANDYLKDYLTCSNEEFQIICKNAVEKALKHQVMNCEQKKWGCQITGMDKASEGWRNMRKQVAMFRFFREPDPVEDDIVRETLDALKTANCQKGYIFSSSGYSNAGRHVAEGRPLELIDKIKLESLLQSAGASES